MSDQMTVMQKMELLAEPFPAGAVSWRVQTTTERNGEHIGLALAYIDARDVQDRLDRVVGPHRWSSEHFDCGGGRLGCRIGIWLGEHWVWKSDGAGATQVEAEKGAFSDAFKRAAVHWGIGRYLYDLGNTWVPCEMVKGKWRSWKVDPWSKVKNASAFLPKMEDAA